MIRIIKNIIALSLVLFVASCSENKVADDNKNWIWVHADENKSEDDWLNIFTKYNEAGIDAILIGANKKVLNTVIPLAHKKDIEVHAWMWTLNRNGDKEAQKHPEWYSVNRLGESCYDKRPYVEYYQWVCPSIPEVQEHILGQVKDLLTIEDLDGVHLDYVRYSDAILPNGLWSKYDIVQDKVYPQWDYGYNQSNIDLFKAEFGYSPLDLEDPNTDENWVKFRLNTVSNLVNKIAELVHSEGKMLTAAVFPSPEMASEMVYQSWSDWNLDAALPMIYHNFYQEDINWIEKTTRDGVETLNGKFPIYSGLFVPDLQGEELKKAMDASLKGGAKGWSLFDNGSFEKLHNSKIQK